MTILGLLIFILLFMAIQLWQGRWAFLISGYRALSASEKAHYDETILCRYIGKMLISYCIGLGIILLGIYAQNIWLFPIGMGLILITAIIGSLFSDNGKRLRKQGPAPSLQQIQSERYSVLDMGIIGGMLIGFTALIIIIAYRQPRVTITKDVLRIHALYGETIKLSDIENVTLLEQSMKDIGTGNRINAFDAFGTCLRGNFDQGLLFIDILDTAPTILIERTDAKPIYISFQGKYDTDDLYKKIMTHLDGDSSSESPDNGEEFIDKDLL